MRKQTMHKFGGMDKDTPFAQRSPDLYYDANNIKLINNGANKSVTKHEAFEDTFVIPDVLELFNSRTGELYISHKNEDTGVTQSLPIYNTDRRAGTTPHTNLQIVGTVEINDVLAVVAVSNKGMTFIYTYYNIDPEDERFGLKLYYANYLGMKQNQKISLISNYENTAIQKLYWTDTINQLRHINLSDEDVSTVPPYLLDLVTPVTFIEPTFDDRSSGAGQKGGMIQYAYSLYNLSGSETKLSPFSKLIPIVDPTTGKGGGITAEVDGDGAFIEELVNVTMEMSIARLDHAFSFIRVYALKYTEANTVPAIRMIIDSKITVYEDYSFTDAGDSSIIKDITIEELLAKGGTILTPFAIETRSNRLFLANYKRKSLAIEFDARAYKFPRNKSKGHVYDSPSKRSTEDVPGLRGPLDEDFNCYNDDEGAAYQRLSDSFGATGEYVTLNVEMNDLIRKVSDGTTDTPIFYYGNATKKSDKYWNATTNTLYNKDDVVIGPLTPDTLLTEELRTAYLIVEDGDQDLHNDGELTTYNKDQWLQVVKFVDETGAMEPIIRYEQTASDSVTTYKDVHVDKSFKRGENYRFAIEFYNDIGERSDAKWICDYRFPYSETLEQTYSVSVSLTRKGVEEMTANNLIMYKLLMVERDPRNRSIVAQGIVNPMMQAFGFNAINTCSKTGAITQAAISEIMPYYTHKDYTSTKGGNIFNNYNQDIDYNDVETYGKLCYDGGISLSWSTHYVHRRGRGPKVNHSIQNFFTPELMFGETINSATTLRILGTATLDNEKSASHLQKAKEIKPSATRTISKGIYFGTNRYMQESGSGEDKDSTIGWFAGFNKVYGGVKLPLSRVWGARGAKSPDSFPRKFLTDSDVEMESSVYLIDTGLPKTIEGSIITADGRIGGFVAGGTGKNGGAHGKMGMNTTFNSFGALFFKEAQWSAGINQPLYHSFSLGKPDESRKALIAELVIELDAQYGGYSYSARQRNVYVPIGGLADARSYTSKSLGDGDVWITPFRYLRNTSNTEGIPLKNKEWYLDEWVTITIETALDLKTRYDDLDETFDSLYSANGVQLVPAGLDTVSTGVVRNNLPTTQYYNFVYGKVDKIKLNMSRSDSFRDQDRFPTTIISSKSKINNEKVDSWLLYDTINTLTLPSKYGEIRELSLANDELVSFQRSAICFISVDPRIQTVADDGLSIGLGVGKALSDYKYITTTSGLINRWSIVHTKDALFYFDYDNRSINMLSQPEREVSTTTGISKFLWDYIEKNKQLGSDGDVINTDTIGNEIVGHYDNMSENSYYSFHGDTKMTVSYNNLLNVMVSFHDFAGNDYINYRGGFLKVNGNKVSTLGYDYFGKDEEVDMSVTVLNSEAAQLIKRYDNLEIDNDVNFNTIQCTNSYQDSGVVPFIAKSSVLRKRQALPRAPMGKRLRDDHLYVKLTYDGAAQINFEYLTLVFNIDKTYYIDG